MVSRTTLDADIYITLKITDAMRTRASGGLKRVRLEYQVVDWELHRTHPVVGFSEV